MSKAPLQRKYAVQGYLAHETVSRATLLRQSFHGGVAAVLFIINVSLSIIMNTIINTPLGAYGGAVPGALGWS